jgi:hypothetical protein
MARTSRARRSSGRRSPRTRTSARTGIVEIFTYPQQHLFWRIVGFLVRRRAELTVLAVALIARFWTWPWLVDLIGRTAALLTATALILGVLVTPVSRRYLIRRWWCVTTRHRMRACFKQTRTMTHHGRLPLLVWSRPSPVGEKVRVWLPAGLSVNDLEHVVTETAAACWAADVRVTPSRRQAALVVVDVIRRDPLTGQALRPQVIDDLTATSDPYTEADGTTADGTGVDGTGVGQDSTGSTDSGRDTGRDTVDPLPSRATLPPPAAPHTGDAPDGHTPAAKPRTRKEPASTPDTDDTPVTGFGGVDVSDYV